MAPAKFQPHTIEITKKLDFSEADEKAAREFRENPFGDEDALLGAILGPQLRAADIIILWARFGEFVQRIVVAAQVQEPLETPIHTQEFTRRYRVQGP